MMRLIRTQAKATRDSLIKAQNILLEAIKKNDYRELQNKLQQELNVLPVQAMQIVKDLAVYENKFTTKQLDKHSPVPVVRIPDELIAKSVDTIKISTTINKPSQTIPDTYRTFVATKSQQYVQIVQDAQLQDMDEDSLSASVREKTSGLFSTQNLALATLAIVGTANYVRNQVANENLLQVDWVLDLELNNCSYCEDMADNGPYNPTDVDGLIPAHANCGCTLIPILDSLGGDEDAADE